MELITTELTAIEFLDVGLLLHLIKGIVNGWEQDLKLELEHAGMNQVAFNRQGYYQA